MSFPGNEHHVAGLGSSLSLFYRGIVAVGGRGVTQAVEFGGEVCFQIILVNRRREMATGNKLCKILAINNSNEFSTGNFERDLSNVFWVVFLGVHFI